VSKNTETRSSKMLVELLLFLPTLQLWVSWSPLEWSHTILMKIWML